MKNKKLLLILSGIVIAGILAGILFAGFRMASAVNHGRRIAELLQPVLEAENQRMHIGISAELDGKPLDLESDVFLVTEAGRSYLAVEQNQFAVFVTDNVLFLENGKAFRLGGKMQAHMTSYEELLSRIGGLYSALQIREAQTDEGTVYEITVTEDRMDALLAVVFPGDNLPLEGIRSLELSLTEKNGKLETIQFFGSGDTDGTSTGLHVILSGFRILAPGDYPIPEAVKESAAAVDPNELFSLTEDLYRLVRALAPFGDRESIEGTLRLAVDCGPLQLDTEIRLSDLKPSATGKIDPGQLRALPEMLGFLCMEGDLRCTREGDAYVYGLELDQQDMENLSQMILPELGQYGSSLTGGTVTVILENDEVTSMGVSIGGSINAVILQIPIAVNAEFAFE